MGRVRAFEEGDIHQVAALHRRVFPLPAAGATGGLDAYRAYFKETFLDSPWSDGQPSLVFEDGDGTPIGFLGVMTRRMMLGHRPITVVTSSQFIVDPTRRATLAGVELLRALLAGPQDLTLADEASDISRKLWEGLGGATDLLSSLCWVRLFRPVEYTVSRWRTGGRKTAPRARTLLCRFADSVVTRWPGVPFCPPMPMTSGEDLDGDILATCIAEHTRTRALRPAYTGGTATWLLKFLARKPGCGTLRKVLVRTRTGEVAGWYLYCGDHGGIGDVLQVGATDERVGDVLDHLFAQAWREGAVALIGRVDPRFMSAFAARKCLFHHRGYWTLVHSRDPQLLDAIRQGDAFLTRLEGEWCMRFQVRGA
jgi:hypothetical protein